MSAPDLFADAPQPVWNRPKHRMAGGRSTVCGRLPEAGPGSCPWWWEGCPKAERRGCYQRWFHLHHPAGDPRMAPK